MIFTTEVPQRNHDRLVAWQLKRPIKKVCSWCNTVTQEGREPVSHGMCPGCYEKHKDALEEWSNEL